MKDKMLETDDGCTLANGLAAPSTLPNLEVGCGGLGVPSGSKSTIGADVSAAGAGAAGAGAP